jgi:tetratricopeptide (TPR) repeat protein
MLVLAALLPGCGPSGNVEPSTPLGFASLADGSPEAQASHLEGLGLKYRTAPVNDPRVARANLDAYTRAVIETAQPLWENREAPTSLRIQAGEALLNAWLDRLEIDEDAYESLLTWADRLEAEAPEGSTLGQTAAYHRFLAVESLPSTVRPDPEERKQMRYDAAVKLARSGSQRNEVPELLNRVADEALAEGRLEQAQELYASLGRLFGDRNILGRRAEGIAHRLERAGKVVDDIEGQTIDGQTLRVTDLRGKVVLIVFWAPFPVVVDAASFPEIESLRKAHPDALEVVGILFESTPIRARQAVEARGIEWPQIVPVGGMDPNDAVPQARLYGVPSWPYFLVLDRAGRLVATGGRLAEIENALNEALAQAPEPAEEPKPAESETPPDEPKPEEPPDLTPEPETPEP